MDERRKNSKHILLSSWSSSSARKPQEKKKLNRLDKKREKKHSFLPQQVQVNHFLLSRDSSILPFNTKFLDPFLPSNYIVDIPFFSLFLPFHSVLLYQANLRKSFDLSLQDYFFSREDSGERLMKNRYRTTTISMHDERTNDDDVVGTRSSHPPVQFRCSIIVAGIVTNGQRHLPGFWEHHCGHIASVFNPRLVRSSMCAASLVYTFSSVE